MDRSANMRAIRSKGMRPELAVRSLVHSMGFRFRLHGKDLPGKPDLVFSPKHKVIFVHGCFWHLHKGCRIAHFPKSNVRYWRPKLHNNQMRDKNNVKMLRTLGWKILVVWECEIRDHDRLAKRIKHFLTSAITQNRPMSIT
jgi:DNA mismatch endonuclease, patch repair protein